MDKIDVIFVILSLFHALELALIATIFDMVFDAVYEDD